MNNLTGRPLDEVANQVWLKLYEQGLTDAEIAQELGTAKSTISGWRVRRGLFPNGQCKSVPPEAALTPAQCVTARRFMSDLVRCWQKGYAYMDVGKFIKGWRSVHNPGAPQRGVRRKCTAGE